jgi:hypothetical protein
MHIHKHLFLPALLLLGACQVHFNRSHDWDGFLLSEVSSEHDGKVVWRLYPGDDGSARIHKTEVRTYLGARLGVSVRSINAQLAEDLGVEAWEGVQITRVDARSPAGRAGLLEDDVILSVAGIDVSSQEQFKEVVERRVSPDEACDVAIVRVEDGTREQVLLRVTPEAKEITESKTDSIRLESSYDVQTLTGMQIATVPGELAREIFESSSPVTLVSGVVVGSPAYHSGLRGGDRIVEVDGEPVSTTQDVLRAVYARAGKLKIASPRVGAEMPRAIPLARSEAGEDSSGRPGRELNVKVDGALGPHRARVAVVDDLDKRSSFSVPIVVDYSSSARRTRWSLLDFIFQFGGNYSSEYRPSATRKTNRTSYLSLLPLGMFEFKRSSSQRSYRLFWLIHWKTHS